MDDNNNMLEFDQPIGQSSYIKVIGVGGGGCNAVNHMCREGINGVDFIVCNTDIKALNASPVPNKIVLGNLGLGAGNKPERAQRAAERQADEIRQVLGTNTNMLFITAGMGGGTGTGAAPVIAKIAKSVELDDEDTKHILVVAVVTTPFSWEGRGRLQQAEAGINALRDNVDSMLVINNDKIRSLGGNMILTQGFVQANNVLLEAVKGISDIITGYGIVNRDFQDVNTVMEGSGRALMGTGSGRGEDRAKEAVMAASTSSLLNDSDIAGAHNMLLYFYFSPEHVITMDEMDEITNYLRSISRNDDANIIWGAGYDETLDDELHIILIATSIDGRKMSAEPELSTARVRTFAPSEPEPVAADEAPASPAKEHTEPSVLPVAEEESFGLPLSLEPGRLTPAPEAEEKTETSAGRRVRYLEDDTPFVNSNAASHNEVAAVEAKQVQTQVLDDMTRQTAGVFEPAMVRNEEFQFRPADPVRVAAKPVDTTESMPAPRRAEAGAAATVDIAMVASRADRVKHLYDLLHNHPDGPQMVENLTTAQLAGDAVYETPHSSRSDAPKTKVGDDGRIVNINNYLFDNPD
ncbi:MAG: cell division protein FtsZ [bacterium P3]|nr:MAG: cell division protein FtsZ [bacterium P3]KWW40514.1 MAG: cell division protein FtsZ [bacterium F083]